MAGLAIVTLKNLPWESATRATILDSADAYIEKTEQSIRVVADIKEDFCNLWRLQDGLQSPSVRAGGFERLLPEPRDVHKVDGVPRFDKDRHRRVSHFWKGRYPQDRRRGWALDLCSPEDHR